MSNGQCSVEGCGSKVKTKGYCLKHYTRVRRHGDPNKNNLMTHGMSKDASYQAWKTMKARCSNPNNKKFPNYGGRGIKVCERWLTFLNFYEDMGKRPEGCTLDRIDNDGDYAPENCRWATMKEQNRNRRDNHMLTIYGKTMTISEWHEIVSNDTNYHTILQRKIRLVGWTDKEAVFGKAKK